MAVHRSTLLALSLTLAAALPASAATSPGFALTRFDPSERGAELFGLDTLDLRGNGRLVAGFVGDYAYKPLVAYGAKDGLERFVLVRHQMLAHVGAGYVVWDRVRFGLDLPVALVASGESGRIGDASFLAPTGTAMGDVRVSADARISGWYGQKLTTAAGISGYVPSGSAAAYAGDSRMRVGLHFLASGQVGKFVWTARAGFQYRALELKVDKSSIGSDANLSAGAGYRLLDDRLLVEGELLGATRASKADALTAVGSPVEALLGAHYALTPEWRLGLGVARGVTSAFGEPAVRFIGGLDWTPGVLPPDRDADGFPDVEDACPDEEGVRSAVPARHGCPLHDRDHDGIADEDDACVGVAGIASIDPKQNGCPPDLDKDGVPDAEDACVDVPGPVASKGCPPDRDHDGVPDAVDACPDDAGVKTDDPLTNGCPPDKDHDGIADAQDACVDVPGVKTADPKTNGCPSDRDHDGIPDADDACPDQPGVADPDPTKNGCPTVPDRDRDGIPDADDACPDVAGVASTEPKEHGCPPDKDHDGIADAQDACVDVPGVADADPAKNGCPPPDDDGDEVPDAVDACRHEKGLKSADPAKNGCPEGKVVNGQIVLDQVKFKTDSDVILKESDETLQKVVDAIRTLPDATRFRVEGHTDNKGNAKHNKDLSQRRAKSVVAWMVKHGVAAKRFDAQGFGPDRPIDTNDTDQGRQNNRRVEFHLLP